jgi:hypothetical protein
MRQPGVHITQEDFIEILKNLDIKGFPIEAFFRLAKRKALLTRSIKVTNNKTNKRVSNITLASNGDAALVADLLYATRIKLKHRGVRKITEVNQRDWTSCKKLAQICNNFCQDFHLETREGFITYIEIGISRMNNNRNLLPRLISMAENISNQYAAQLEIGEDKNPKQTKSIHDYYVKRIADSTGILETYENEPDKYLSFIQLKDFLNEHHWDFRLYIDAQFEALAWCNGIPDVESLYSDKAVQRFNKYLYTAKKRRNNPGPETKGSLWDIINKKK